MKFILTIDTEGDNQWDHGREISVENVKHIPRFQDLCDKYLIRPTYLVTSEICEDNFAKKLFTDYILSGKAEIGAHLHSWTTPPFLDQDGYTYNDRNHAFASELPEDLLTEKIKNITNQIEVSFGRRPFSFRSGRFGFNENVARILAENLYLVDTSVTPFTDWSVHKGIPGGSGGENFLDSKPFPYQYAFGSKSLLEIPVTVLPTRFPLNRNEKLARYYFRNVNDNLLLRVFRKMFFSSQPLWLRPFIWSDMQFFDELIKESFKIRLPFIVMMFHSSELMPGCSKYRPDEASIEQLYDLLELFFVKLQNRNIKSVTLTEAAKGYKI
jgi:hypothetical protein